MVPIHRGSRTLPHCRKSRWW